ncbi:hypothetical protein BC829DRAFT_389390 [Chytridium lagenaria]|nr:hypothetical protein BC829DRAFT_389390 [Chytridium lagenaria]
MSMTTTVTTSSPKQMPDTIPSIPSPTDLLKPQKSSSIAHVDHAVEQSFPSPHSSPISIQNLIHPEMAATAFTKPKSLSPQPTDHNNVQNSINLSRIQPYWPNIHTRSSSDPSHAGHVCTVCGKRYPTTKSLRSHHVTHTRSRQHPCKYCQKSFYTVQDLERHIATHTKEKNHKCRCGVSFARSDALRRHMLAKGCEKKFDCESKVGSI